MGGRVAISRFSIGSIRAFAAAHFGATLVTATVRAEHQAFDRRMLQVRHLAAPAADPTLLTPLTLMTAEFRDHVTADVFHRTPFVRPDPARARRSSGLHPNTEQDGRRRWTA
jgi:2-oxoglutarate dehydrogenase complex dehydrogenase (E1) component-like enzyme